jgi:immune inhibitor A
MCRHPPICGRRFVCLFLAAAAYAALAPPPTQGVPPRPGLYDPQTGLSTTTGEPRPDFPDWFGTGLRPLQPVSGEGRVVALLIDFPDRQANTVARPASFYNDLLFSRGTHPTGSFRDFYLEQSYGTFDVTGQAFGWLRASEEYYTTYDDGNGGFSGGAQGVFVAAVLLADSLVDFGLFDSDGPDGTPNSGDDDGYVDACLIFFSGLGMHDTGSLSDIWPHATIIEPPIETNDPRNGGGHILIEGYSMQPEVNLNAAGDDTLDSFIGVAAHEYGHQLGLVDLYDGSRETWGIGYWGLMGYGAFGEARTGPYGMSAWSKMELGWLVPAVVTDNLLDVTIPPVETAPVAYKVWRDGAPGEEYFILENRQNIGFDTYLPGHGLLIWHIDETMFPTGAPSPVSDTTADGWFRIALEQADGRNDLATWFERPDTVYHFPELGDGADPFPGDSSNTRFDDYSNPSSRDNDGQPTDVSIVDIAQEGDDIRMSIVIDSALVAVYVSSFVANTTDDAIELAWDVRADEPIEGFVLYRRRMGSDREIRIPADEPISPDRRRYVDGDVRPGDTYRYVLGAVRPGGLPVLRSYPIEVSVKAVALTLHQNYPNPFHPTTTISFSLPEEARVELSVFDVQGKLVRTLEDKILPAGFHEAGWNGRDRTGNRVGSGVYFCRLRAGKHTVAKKMILLR